MSVFAHLQYHHSHSIKALAITQNSDRHFPENVKNEKCFIPVHVQYRETPMVLTGRMR
jgi:hypothetical protein